MTKQEAIDTMYSYKNILRLRSMSSFGGWSVRIPAPPLLNSDIPKNVKEAMKVLGNKEIKQILGLK